MLMMGRCTFLCPHIVALFSSIDFVMEVTLVYLMIIPLYSMCSLVVSVLDSPAVDPRSNPGSGSALLMSANLRLYTTSPVVICE